MKRGVEDDDLCVLGLSILQNGIAIFCGGED